MKLILESIHTELWNNFYGIIYYYRVKPCLTTGRAGRLARGRRRTLVNSYDTATMDVGLRLWLERDGKLEVIEVGQDRERKKVVGVDIAILECNTDGPRIEYGLVRSQ